MHNASDSSCFVVYNVISVPVDLPYLKRAQPLSLKIACLQIGGARLGNVSQLCSISLHNQILVASPMRTATVYCYFHINGFLLIFIQRRIFVDELVGITSDE